MGSLSGIGRTLLAMIALMPFAAPSGAAPDKLAAARKKYEAAAHKNTFEIGKAHIELGIWARDAGLPIQATAEFLRAEELAGDEMPIAGKIVAIMRAYGDKFWKSVQKHPVALLRTYENKADKIEADGLKDRLRLAKDAASWGLDEESFADTYGGTGTFTWDGKAFMPGGMLAKGLTDGIKTDEGFLPLADLTAGDALALLSKDRPKASRFYAESWAFLRFLRTGSLPEIRDRFRLWELACKGGAIGAKAGKARDRDTAPGREAFQKSFGADLPALEKAFRAWLATL